jgi:mono/diheme cytochrome c family protein
MRSIKVVILIIYCAIAAIACFSAKSERYTIAAGKDYEASLFRQNCAICHGPEGEGRTLEDGTVVPNMRDGELKFRTEAEISRQISDGGNGMPPFRDQLTQHELDMMTKFVHDKLRRPMIK